MADIIDRIIEIVNTKVKASDIIYKDYYVQLYSIEEFNKLLDLLHKVYVFRFDISRYVDELEDKLRHKELYLEVVRSDRGHKLAFILIGDVTKEDGYSIVSIDNIVE